MNARSLPPCAVLAALVPCVPAAAQNVVSQPGTVNRSTESFTLLTGPRLLSPPTRPLESSSISSEVVRPGAPAPEREGAAFRFRPSVPDAPASTTRPAQEEMGRWVFQPGGPRVRLAPDNTEPKFSAPTKRPAPESLRFDSPGRLSPPSRATPAETSRGPTPAASVTPTKPD